MKKLSASIPFSLILLAGFALGGCATTQTAQEEPAAAPAQTSPAPRPAPQPRAPEPRTEAPRPAPAPAPAPAQPEPTGPADDYYTVRPGDNLWDISGMPDIYGDPYRWPLIYKANQDKIADADLIYPGQTLTITRGNAPFEIDAAIHHARTRGAWTLGVVEETDREYLAGGRYAGAR